MAAFLDMGQSSHSHAPALQVHESEPLHTFSMSPHDSTSERGERSSGCTKRPQRRREVHARGSQSEIVKGKEKNDGCPLRLAFDVALTRMLESCCEWGNFRTRKCPLRTGIPELAGSCTCERCRNRVQRDRMARVGA